MAQISPERLSISTHGLKPMSYTFTLDNQGEKKANLMKIRKRRERIKVVDMSKLKIAVSQIK